ncbi:Os09g0457532 [Oryza sativa Japonica Group]|uniref:Os09g0457532 protein n=1 Tax=Oryza sativa subsp. japonica TaxID=39947 RepID=A0A0P0XP97_ORYSJ|nr:hypothetical protein EE612_048286 [Oryza sativa]BAT08443.1 Os09g0457532 [Oryza sativa Japonica Group]
MTLSEGNGHEFCVEPVSWLSMKVTAFSGSQPIIPGALPLPSFIRHSSPCTAACSSPLVVKSNADAGPPTACAQFTSSCRSPSWFHDGSPLPS